MNLKNRCKIGLLASVFALQACTATMDDGGMAASTPENSAVTAMGPGLWKVADEDTTIYLFGTVHALPSDVNWKTPAVATALAEADSLVTEIDMTPEILATIGPMMQQKGTLPAGQTLRSLMTDEQRGKYEAGLAQIGIPAGALDTLEPWLAAVSLTQIMIQRAGYTPESGVERVLEAAVPAGTDRVALETVEYGINIFDSLPMDKQVEYLVSSLENTDEGMEMLREIIAEWAEGDVEEVAELMARSLAETPDLAERLLYVRNANWAEWIDTRLDTPGTAFMAVGAGHLAGERSVQIYLAQRGIKTQRVQ